MLLEKPAHHVDERRDVSDPSSWIAILADAKSSGNDLFALWHDDKIIGMTGILYENKRDPLNGVAVLTSIQLADAYVGRGLSSILYDVPKNYLKETGFKGVLETYIKEDNINSIRAAERSGFVLQKDRIMPIYNVYRLRDDARDFVP